MYTLTFSAGKEKKKNDERSFFLLVKCVTLTHYSDSVNVITLVTYGVIKPRNVHITLCTLGQYLGAFVLTTCQSRGGNIFRAILVVCSCHCRIKAKQRPNTREAVFS